MRNLVVLPLIYLATTAALLLAFGPLSIWAMALGLAIAAHRHLGHWPNYNQPDPSLLPTDMPFSWLESALPLLSMLVGLSMCFFALHRIKNRRWWFAAVPAIIAVGWVSGIGLLALDPWGVFEWYVD